MADKDFEKWAAKSRRIEAERAKAAEALSGEKPDKTNLAFLDPKTTKVKGWSGDPDVLLSAAERMGNRSIIIALAGVVLNVIGFAGGMVSFTNKLGLASAVVSSLPSWLGMACFAIAGLMGLATIGVEIYFKIKKGRRLDVGFWSAIGGIAVIILYYLVQWLITRIS